MNFSLGLLENTEDLIIRKFEQGVEAETQKIPFYDSADDIESIHCLFSNTDFSKSKDSMLIIKKAMDYNISNERFSQLSYLEAKKTLKQVIEQTTLQSNLLTIEEVFSLAEQLKEELHRSRNNFFIELWRIIKTNLGTTDLNILFKDLAPGGSDTLITKKVSGRNIPQVADSSPAEGALFEDLSADFGPALHCCEYDQLKGELVMTSIIDGTSIIVLAKVLNFTLLQKSVLRSLFSGLSRKN